MSADDSTPITGSGAIHGQGASIHGTARTRMNMSLPHLLSACFFSRAVCDLEGANLGKRFGSFWQEILAHATASIFLTVASLESYANELFADRDKNFPNIPSEILLKLWELYDQKPILEKFDLALLLRTAGSVDRGCSPAQDVYLLIRLRNALVHFKPEWFGEQEEHAKLANQLAGRFTRSPFFGVDEPLFPRGWATHGCTAWAIGSAVDFIDTIERQAGLASRLDKFRARLTP